MEWYTTRHSLINYVSYFRDWQPDAVIIMHGINDLYRSFSPPEYAAGEYDELWTHFYGPSIQGVKPPTFEGFIIRHYLAGLFDTWYSMFRFKEEDYALESFISRPMFERNLRRLTHYARADGATVVFIAQPALYKNVLSQEEAAVMKFGRILCNRPSGFLSREYPSPGSLSRAMSAVADLTKRVAVEEGALWIDAHGSLPRDLEHFYDEIHYTERGSRLLAELVASRIIDSDLPLQ